MSTNAGRIAVMMMVLVLALIGYAAYEAQPLMLYVIAMFGGSYQYEPMFFFILVGSLLVTGIVLSEAMERMIFGKKEKKSA